MGFELDCAACDAPLPRRPRASARPRLCETCLARAVTRATAALERIAVALEALASRNTTRTPERSTPP